MVEVVEKPLYTPSRLERAYARVMPERGKRRIVRRMISAQYQEMHRTLWGRFSHKGAGSARMDRDWAGNSSWHDERTDGASKDQLRQRAQRLYEVNALANGIVDRCVENVVGQGIQVQARSGSKAWNKKAEAAFNDWAYSGADVRRLGDFFTHIQPTLFREHLINGDGGAILVDDGSLQIINGDMIETPPNQSADDKVIDGVRINRLGRPTKFYVREGDDISDDYTTVDRRDFIYYPHISDSRDTRGTSYFQQAINANLFDQLDANIEAVVAASQMAAMFGLLIKQVGGLGTISNLQQTTDAAGNAAREFPMEPAMVKYLLPGEDVSQITPQQPGQNWPDFISLVSRFLGLPFGLPLELILMDFSRTNYSSARASLLQAYRVFRCHQQRFINVVLRRVWRWRISKFTKENVLPERSDMFKHEWLPPGWQWVDPQKEAVGHLLALDAGYGTLADICVGLGKDFGEVVEQRKQEVEAMKAAGLDLVHSNMTRDVGADGNGRPDNERDTDE